MADEDDLNPDAVLFGQRLLALRKARNMTQMMVADRCGCEAKDISAYENGKRLPQQRRQFRLAVVLEADRAWMMGFEHGRRPQGVPVPTIEGVECAGS